MNPLADAFSFSQLHEVAWPRDPLAVPAVGQVPFGVHHADPVPWNRPRGPLHARGGVSGVVLQHGKEIAAWGEPDRADLTFSVAKTYLALLAGVAHSYAGLLPDPDEPVVERLPGIGFDSEHNRTITWAHLLEQTSEWEGACFGLPDTVDRNRVVSHDPRPVTGKKGDARPLRTPGTYWEYNDVRINQLSLALLHLFRQPLPEVFRETILAPLNAGENFAWRGYDDAWTEIMDSAHVQHRMQSVPGGTHWGGGVSISARDQAKIGQLLLNDGSFNGQQIIPASWVRSMRRPCKIAPFYGWLMWLNADGTQFPGASKDASFMVGAGGHYTWIEPAHDAVIVVRWLDSAHAAGFMQRISNAL